MIQLDMKLYDLKQRPRKPLNKCFESKKIKK